MKYSRVYTNTNIIVQYILVVHLYSKKNIKGFRKAVIVAVTTGQLRSWVKG